MEQKPVIPEKENGVLENQQNHKQIEGHRSPLRATREFPPVTGRTEVNGSYTATIVAHSSQLDAMQLNKLHAATMAPPPTHIKTKEEKGEARQHQRAHRTSSDDNSHSKSAIVENRITTIPELTESFEKRLFLQNKRTTSQDDDKDMCESGGAVQELQCKHRFHKEAARRLEQCRPRSGSEAAAFQARRLSGERRKSADGPIYTEKERFNGGSRSAGWRQGLSSSCGVRAGGLVFPGRPSALLIESSGFLRAGRDRPEQEQAERKCTRGHLRLTWASANKSTDR
ncbi:hypothetical protein Q8A73_008607 [Channa argus]|nr:hypothetical protein Q8A73_008607 [Channa argus]